jgi:hypothetical protein
LISGNGGVPNGAVHSVKDGFVAGAAAGFGSCFLAQEKEPNIKMIARNRKNAFFTTIMLLSIQS